MSNQLYAFHFTEAQCFVLACACEIEAQLLEEMGKEGNLGAGKWAVSLRELQRVLDLKEVFHE